MNMEALHCASLNGFSKLMVVRGVEKNELTQAREGSFSPNERDNLDPLKAFEIESITSGNVE